MVMGQLDCSMIYGYDMNMLTHIYACYSNTFRHAASLSAARAKLILNPDDEAMQMEVAKFEKWVDDTNKWGEGIAGKLREWFGVEVYTIEDIAADLGLVMVVKGK